MQPELKIIHTDLKEAMSMTVAICFHRIPNILFEILFAGAIIVSACNKDPIKSQCHQVYDTKQIWKDSSSGYTRTDTIWRSGSVMCGAEFQKLKNFPPYWVKICNPDGSTGYWEHWVIVIGT